MITPQELLDQVKQELRENDGPVMIYEIGLGRSWKIVEEIGDEQFREDFTKLCKLEHRFFPPCSLDDWVLVIHG